MVNVTEFSVTGTVLKVLHETLFGKGLILYHFADEDTEALRGSVREEVGIQTSAVWLSAYGLASSRALKNKKRWIGTGFWIGFNVLKIKK